MAAAVTYQFYKDVYGGGLSEVAFGLALPAASRHVRWLVGGAEPGDDELESYQRAVCAAVDAFAEFGEGQVGGFSLGDFKVTHYEDEGTTGEEIATADALNSDGAFEVPAGSRIDIGGHSYYVVECKRCEDFNGHVHHWELVVR